MIAMGHNYGTNYAAYPWGGILAMIIFCIFVGSFFSWLTLKTGSAVPAALAHGGLNAFAGTPAVFLAEGAPASPFVGPLPMGIIGGFGYLLIGIVCLILSRKLNQY